jgi:uncharacterized protein YjbI with pentapeptide repeats
MADERQIKILRQGVQAWNDWRRKSEALIDLSAASLQGTELGSIDKDTHLNLWLSNLNNVDFADAELGGATLVNSEANQTVFRGADLAGCDFWGVELDHADLTNSILYDTDFTETTLLGADFTNSVMYGTIFAGVDLSEAKGLDTVRHEGPNRIDLDTIHLSNGKIPEAFMRGSGAPESIITYMESLVVEPIGYYSCFISYSSKDQTFANRLHTTLRRKRMRVWLATEDLKIGDKFRPKIDEAISLYDKLLLVLSKDSVDSPWVEAEVEAAFEKERRQKRPVLFPIRLDDSVMESDRAWAAEIRRTRHIGDFRHWQRPAGYKKALSRLLRDLTSSGKTDDER